MRKPSGVRYGIRRAGGLTALREYDYDEKGGLAIQLVAIQMRLDVADFLTEDAFAAKIDGLLAQAAERLDPKDHTLVAFPEDVGLMLIAQGLRRELAGVSEVADAIRRVTRRFLVPAAWLKFRHGVSWVPAIFLLRHRTVASAYFRVFSEAARKYRVWIVAGSVPLPPYAVEAGRVLWEEGWLAPEVYNSSFLFGPDGKVVGRQDKVHLIELEREAALDLTPGSVDRLRTFETPFGRIGIAICLDAFEDDVVDALTRQGADILVQPSANPGPWTAEQQTDWLRSSYRRVYLEQRFSYALNPMMHGTLWDIPFYGQSSIVTQEDGTALHGYADLGPMPGFHSVAASDREEEVLVAKV